MSSWDTADSTNDANTAANAADSSPIVIDAPPTTTPAATATPAVAAAATTTTKATTNRWNSPDPQSKTNSGNTADSGWGSAGASSTNNNASNTTSSGWGLGSTSNTTNANSGNSGWGAPSNTASNNTGDNWGSSWGPSSNEWSPQKRRSAPMTMNATEAPGLLPPIGTGRAPAPTRDNGWNTRRTKSASGPYAAAREFRRQRDDGGSFESPQVGWADEVPASGSNSIPRNDPAAASSSNHLEFHYSMITRDMSAFTEQIRTHLDKIAGYRSSVSNANQRMDAAAQRYYKRKTEFEAQIRQTKNELKKERLIEELLAFKATANSEQHSLEGGLKLANEASTDSIDSALRTLAQIINEEIQVGVLNALRAIGGSRADVSSILKQMLNIAAPQLVKKFVEDIDAQSQVRIKHLVKTLKEKEAKISELTSKLGGVEARMFNLEQAMTRIEASVQVATPVQVQDQSGDNEMDELASDDETDAMQA